MRKSSISSADLGQALRLQGHTDVSRIRRAYLERSASISVIPYPKDPTILEVSAEEGTQRIRIELE